MAHMQISTETSTWLLQAKEFLDEARRLRPGPARNELRQVAKVLRELAKLEEHLAVLFRDAANLNLQLCELKRLRDRVRQAQRRARKSQRTNLTGTLEEWLAARRHAKNPGEGTLHRLARGESPLTRSLRGHPPPPGEGEVGQWTNRFNQNSSSSRRPLQTAHTASPDSPPEMRPETCRSSGIAVTRDRAVFIEKISSTCCRMVPWHSHAAAASRDRSISIWPRRSDLIAPDARRLRISSVTVVRRTPSICDSACWVSGRTSWSIWSRSWSNQRAMRARTGCSALQAEPS